MASEAGRASRMWHEAPVVATMWRVSPLVARSAAWLRRLMAGSSVNESAAAWSSACVSVAPPSRAQTARARKRAASSDSVERWVMLA